MIEPILSDDALLRDIAAAKTEAGDNLHLWWLGQSGFLVQWQGRHLLLDPYLSESLTEKYAATDKPHIRMTRCPIDPARLDFIDVVTSSHNHTDHLDAATLEPLLRANPNLQLVIPEANRAFVADRLSIDPARPLGMDDGTTVTAAGFTFTGLASAHEQLEQDDAGHHKYLGYLVRIGPWTLYHSGDTLRYDGLAERLREHPIDVALLPINGRATERRVAGNLTGPEAAQLAHDSGARTVIPCHYEMFTFNTEPPDAFINAARRLSQPHHVLRCGERWSNAALD